MIYWLTPTARVELEEIVDQILSDNPSAATRLVDMLERRWELLTAFPFSGGARDDVEPGLRYVIVGNYLSLYRVSDDGIEIVRIIHGRRDLHRL